jgi:hypothetical protein
MPEQRRAPRRDFLLSIDSREDAMSQSELAIGSARFRRRLREQRGRPEKRDRGRLLDGKSIKTTINSQTICPHMDK